MRAAVNVLKSGPKISERTKRHQKQFNLFDIKIKLAKNCRRPALSSVFTTVRPWVANVVLKEEFEAIEVTTYFRSNTFRHMEAMKVILFSKYSKFFFDFDNPKKFQEILDTFEDNCVWS